MRSGFTQDWTDSKWNCFLIKCHDGDGHVIVICALELFLWVCTSVRLALHWGGVLSPERGTWPPKPSWFIRSGQTHVSGMDTDTQTHNDTVWTDVNQTMSLHCQCHTKGNYTITWTVIKTYTHCVWYGAQTTDSYVSGVTYGICDVRYRMSFDKTSEIITISDESWEKRRHMQCPQNEFGHLKCLNITALDVKYKTNLHLQTNYSFIIWKLTYLCEMFCLKSVLVVFLV